MDLVAEAINLIHASYIDGRNGDPTEYVKFSGILSTTEILQAQTSLNQRLDLNFTKHINVLYIKTEHTNNTTSINIL